MQLISGYRTVQTNNSLRVKSESVVKHSYHTLNKAMDFHIEGKPLSMIRKAALKLRIGGVRYYPRSNFVHIDTSPAYTWHRAAIPVNTRAVSPYNQAQKVIQDHSMKYHIMPVTAFSQNCSLVWCEQTGEAALVDPGGEAQRLRQEVAALGVTVKEIWLTHGHLDHVGAASELAAFYRVPLVGCHRDDEPLLANLPGQCQMFGMESIAPLVPDRWLADGATVSVGTLSFSVLHCPGHSPGHVVFWNKAAKFILMGDVLFNSGIGRTDLPGGDSATLMRSIHHQLMPLADDIAFLPGHGPMSTLGHERRMNPFLQQ